MNKDMTFDRERKNFFTLLKQIVKEEAENVEEFKVSIKVKVFLAALFLLPLLIQVVAIACGKPDIGYWMFLPDMLIIMFLIIRKQRK